MNGLVIVIPAAGAAARMRGADKLLEPVDGQPLLVRQVEVALETGHAVRVTLPPDRPKRTAALTKVVSKNLSIQKVESASEGISASIRAGVIWAETQEAQGLMILLADLPEIDAEDLRAMAAAFARAPARVWRATDASGGPGHPVILPARLFDRLLEVRGDDGARAVIEAEDVGHVRLPGRHATTDLDTPEDWAAWRASRGGSAPGIG